MHIVTEIKIDKSYWQSYFVHEVKMEMQQLASPLVLA